MMMAGNNKTATTRSIISSSFRGDRDEKMSSIHCGLLPSLFTIHESLRETEATKKEEKHLHPIIIHVECLGCCKHMVRHQQQETHPQSRKNSERRKESSSWSVVQQKQLQQQHQQIQIQIRKLHHRLSRWDTDSTSSHINKSVAVIQSQQQQPQQPQRQQEHQKIQVRKLHHRTSRLDTDSTCSTSMSSSSSSGSNSSSNNKSVAMIQSQQQQQQQQQLLLQIRKLHHRLSRWDTDSTRILSTSTSPSINSDNDKSMAMIQQQQQQQPQRQRSSGSIDSPPVSPIRQKSLNTYKYQNGDRVVSFEIPLE